MPYVNDESRNHYDEVVDAVIEKFRETARRETTSAFPGDLNYVLTRIVLGAWISAAEEDNFQLGYSDIDSMISCLIRAAGEIDRRVLSEYEKGCIKRNGDVKEYKKIKKVLKK